MEVRQQWPFLGNRYLYRQYLGSSLFQMGKLKFSFA